MELGNTDGTNQSGSLKSRLKIIGIIAAIFSVCSASSSQIYKFFEQKVFPSWVKSSPILAPIAITVLLFLILLVVFTIVGFLIDRRALAAFQRISEKKKAEKERDLAEKRRKNRTAAGRWLEKQCELLVRFCVCRFVNELNIELQYLQKITDEKRECSTVGLNHLAELCRLARDYSPICNLQEHPRVLAALQGNAEEQAIRELCIIITQSFDKTYQLLVKAGDQKLLCIHKVDVLREDVTDHIIQLKRIATDLQKV